ncbi:MAG: 3-phosphoshikimate 1-carboxyvinyltransferase [Planctomycetota bacterium]|jgi:3-phosphoshikimate 1-carboxyvinyltransferase|nr:3-phosphoshikimate 1-carboxyvinyltransferase [Planctomycetota bacterium]
MMPAGPLAIAPLHTAPTVTWAVPGSKSLTNRALILAAMADGRSVLRGVLESDDTTHMRAGLEAMGVRIETLSDDCWAVHGGTVTPPEGPIFVGNSGTTVRFLTALCATLPGTSQLQGDEHMAKRPISDLTDALLQLGVNCDCATGCPPLQVHGGTMNGGTVHMRGDRSSQYFSALLMAGAGAPSPLEIAIDGALVSQPYVAMTLRMIRDFGGSAEQAPDGFVVQPAAYQAHDYLIEPDASAASYPLALAAASGGTVTVPRLGQHALQGDVAFTEVLAGMGAQVSSSDAGITVRGPARGQLRGVDVDMHHISDTVMSLAAIAPLATSPTTIRNVANIRIKETDRLAATVAELRRLGQTVEHGDDWLRISPGPVSAATVECYADHRMAMSFAILGLCTPGVTIADPACVAKTYPRFWADLGAVYRAQEMEVPW